MILALVTGFFLVLSALVKIPPVKHQKLAVVTEPVEEFLDPEPRPPGDPILPVAAVARTVWVTVSSHVSVSGASSSLAVVEQLCDVKQAVPPLKSFKYRALDEAMAVTDSQAYCVAVAADVPLSEVRTVYGRWTSPSRNELPEVSDSVRQWSYTTPAGMSRVITTVAVGYCESDEGGCVGGTHLEDGDAASVPYVRITLPGAGVGPIFLNQ